MTVSKGDFRAYVNHPANTSITLSRDCFITPSFFIAEGGRFPEIFHDVHNTHSRDEIIVLIKVPIEIRPFQIARAAELEYLSPRTSQGFAKMTSSQEHVSSSQRFLCILQTRVSWKWILHTMSFSFLLFRSSSCRGSIVVVRERFVASWLVSCDRHGMICMIVS